MSKRPIIVVGGSAYADIDVLACASAYKQYLDLQGRTAHALITGPWNQTIPPSVRKWDIPIEKEFSYNGQPCDFVLVDFSDPKFVNSFVDLNNVVEVFDHHYGYEDYWKEKIGDGAKIEKVGACATMIWEKFKNSGIENKISIINANLLYTAIFANTLDFKSAVTQDRDKIAARELSDYIQLPTGWHAQYYAEIEGEFLENSLKNILEDTKSISLLNRQFNFGQIELANARAFLDKSMVTLRGLGLKEGSEEWIVNIVSIEESCSYLYCNNDYLIQHLKEITTAKDLTHRGLMVTPRLWLRKELLKEMHLR